MNLEAAGRTRLGVASLRRLVAFYVTDGGELSHRLVAVPCCSKGCLLLPRQVSLPLPSFRKVAPSLQGFVIRHGCFLLEKVPVRQEQCEED